MKDCWGALPGARVDGVDAAISAWAAELCTKTLDKEPSKEKETKYAPVVKTAQNRELSAWKELRVSPRRYEAKIAKTISDAPWVLACKVTEGRPSVMARLVAKGFQDPDLQQGLVETAGCEGLRLSHLQ